LKKKKQRQRQRQLNQPLRPSGYAPAFGTAVGRFAAGLDAGLKPGSISTTTADATAKANNGNDNSKSRSSTFGEG
jgi:hypothetical protein